MIQLRVARGIISYRKPVSIPRTPIVIIHTLSILKFNKVLIKKTKAKYLNIFLRAYICLVLFFNSFYSALCEQCVTPIGDLKFWFIDNDVARERTTAAEARAQLLQTWRASKLCKFNLRPIPISFTLWVVNLHHNYNLMFVG